MARLKFKAGSRKEREAAAAIAGGDLRGSDFRQAKRDINRQRRKNRRAKRKAERRGVDPAGFGFKKFTDQEKLANEYFKDLSKGRTARIAGGAALAAGAVLAAPAIGAAIAAKGGAGAALKAGAVKAKAAAAKAKPFLKKAQKVKQIADAASSIAQAAQPQPLPPMQMPAPQVSPMDFSQMYGMPSSQQFSSMAPPPLPFDQQMYQGAGLGMAFPQFQMPNPYLYQ